MRATGESYLHLVLGCSQQLWGKNRSHGWAVMLRWRSNRMGRWTEGMEHNEGLMELDPHHPPTCTDDTSILHVPTVVHSPAAMPAAQQGGLIPTTLHIVQQDAACASTKVSAARGGDGRPTAQLTAHHLRVPQAPKIVTHCAPALPVLHLHTALAGMSAVGQPHTGTWGVEHWTQSGYVRIPQQNPSPRSSHSTAHSSCRAFPQNTYGNIYPLKGHTLHDPLLQCPQLPAVSLPNRSWPPFCDSMTWEVQGRKITSIANWCGKRHRGHKEAQWVTMGTLTCSAVFHRKARLSQQYFWNRGTCLCGGSHCYKYRR